MTVLLLESDPVRRRAYRGALMAAGQAPVVALDPADACDELAEARAWPWRVAVLDAEALCPDAWARIAELTTGEERPRVLLLCAPPPAGEESPREERLPAGTFDRLFHPVTPRRLAALVRRAAREHKLAHEERRWRMAELAYDLELERDNRALDERIGKLVEAPRLRRQRTGELAEGIAVPLAEVREQISRALAEVPQLEAGCRSALEDAVSATERVMRMSLDLRDVNLAADGALCVEVVEVDVGQMLQRVVASLSRLAGDFHARVQLQIEGELGHVPADEAFLSRSLLNLIERAVRQSRRGVVEVSAHRSARELHISVADSGLAVPEALRERIFEAEARLLPLGNVFHRGLALPFCRAAVEAQGGRIWADQSPSGGACFRVALSTTALPRTQEISRLVA